MVWVGDLMSAAIDIEDLTVRYGDVLALDDVSLKVEAGSICAIIGMNGAGKSTLFKSVLGQVRTSTGNVRLLGLDPASARRAARVAYVPQQEQIDQDFPVSVRDVVMMGRYGMQGLGRRVRPQDRDAVRAAIAEVQLTDLASRQIGSISGGQRKRAFLARAIAQDADILLLDEPFSGVDKPSEQLIVKLLRELAASGKTVLVATHDLYTLPELADEAVLLRTRVLLRGSVAEVLKPQNLALAFGLGEER